MANVLAVFAFTRQAVALQATGLCIANVAVPTYGGIFLATGLE